MRVSAPLPGISWVQCLLLGAAMCLITSSFGLVQPYSAPYLRATGLSKWDINLISGLALLSGMVFQPLIGKLSDKIDARRPVMFLTGILAAGAYGLFPYANGAVQFFLLTMIGLNGFHYLNTVGGVLIGRIAGPTTGGAAYAKFRVFGSIGYVIVAKLSGWLLPHHASLSRNDLTPIFVTLPLFCSAIVFISWWIPDPKKAIRHPSQPTDNIATTAKSTAMPSLIPMFLTAYAFYQGALYGVSANLPLYLTESLKATPNELGTFFAIGVVAEVCIMLLVGRYTDKYGRRPALIVAFCLLPLRLVGYSLAPNPMWATVVQSLHGLNFGIMGAISIAYINDCAEDHKRGTEQARLGVTACVSTALSQWLSGWLLEKFGFQIMFAFMGCVAAIGTVLMLVAVDESHPLLRQNKGFLKRHKKSSDAQ